MTSTFACQWTVAKKGWRKKKKVQRCVSHTHTKGHLGPLEAESAERRSHWLLCTWWQESSRTRWTGAFSFSSALFWAHVFISSNPGVKLSSRAWQVKKTKQNRWSPENSVFSPVFTATCKMFHLPAKIQTICWTWQQWFSFTFFSFLSLLLLSSTRDLYDITKGWELCVLAKLKRFLHSHAIRYLLVTPPLFFSHLSGGPKKKSGGFRSDCADRIIVTS